MSWLRRIFLTVLTLVLLTVGLQTVLRGYFPQPYRSEVEYHAQAHGLDPLLVTAVMYVESSFNPSAVSSKGARGLMQIMPETARWAAQQMGMEPFSVEMLFDPEINVAIGVWYLANLRSLFDGETVLALAAYNGGRGNVMRWLSEQSWSGSVDEIDDIPFPETRSYVRKVLLTYTWYRWIWKDLFQ